jgi:hypothetical protein
VRGEAESIRDATISGYHGSFVGCIRDETWSLTLCPGALPDELYNLNEDPQERRNVIEQHRDVAQELISKFDGFPLAARPVKFVPGAPAGPIARPTGGMSITIGVGLAFGASPDRQDGVSGNTREDGK